jgi:indolepyruvate ferredoxin oxidoreductase
MAAHIEGKGTSVLDMTGLAQKNGAVISHIRVARQPEDIHAVRVAAGGADLLLGCDIVVAASDEALAKVGDGTTSAVINRHQAPTASFTLDNDLDLGGEDLERLIRNAAGDNRADFLDATGLATTLMGDAIATNLFLLGYAFQRGLVPVSLEALERAIELNGVAVEINKRTLAWGRLAAHDPGAVDAAARPARPLAAPVASETLDEVVARRVAFLTEYQDAAYAERYAELVRRTQAAERERAKGMTGLAEAVARYYFKLLAYKDEYEVARLYTDGGFRRKLEAQFEGDFKLQFHLAPPLIAPRDPATGELRKITFGPWMLRAMTLLARFRRLRGTRWDVFGRTEERRGERQLIADYAATIEELIAGLETDNHALAVEIAKIPEVIRGFGHVKARNLEAAKAHEAQLLAAFRDPSARAAAAE